MTISEAYDARLQNALAAGLTMEQAKERIDATEEAEFRVEAQYGIDNHFCFYGILSNSNTVANIWGATGPREKQRRLAHQFAASPNMRKALQAVIAAGFDCMTDEQFAAIDLVEATLKRAENSAE